MQAPPCDIDGVLHIVLMRISFLRQKFDPSARIVMSKLDVNRRFAKCWWTQPASLILRYVFGNMAVVNSGLESGLRSSPGYPGLLAATLKSSYNKISCFTYMVTENRYCDSQSIKMAPRQPEGVATLPVDSKSVRRGGRGVGDPFFIRVDVGDGSLVKVQYLSDGMRCLYASRSSISDHCRLLGERGPG